LRGSKIGVLNYAAARMLEKQLALSVLSVIQ